MLENLNVRETMAKKAYFSPKHITFSKHYTLKGRGIGLILLGIFYNFPHGREVILHVFPIDEPLMWLSL